MDFYDLIKNRESIRNYDPSRRVPTEIIKRILNASRLAPSAANYQPWKFIVASSPLMLEKIRPCYHREWFKDAPHVIIIVGDKTKAWKRSMDGYNSIETDLAIAMTHVILAAENEGVGTCWVANFDLQALRTALGLVDDQVVYSITPLGYPREGFRKLGNKSRLSMDEVTEIL